MHEGSERYHSISIQGDRMERREYKKDPSRAIGRSLLEGGREHYLSVNKGKYRDFLALCVDLATADPAHYEAAFLASMKRGDFFTDFANENAFSWFGKQIPELVACVNTLAACVSGEGVFGIEAQRASGIWVENCAIVSSVGNAGFVEFYREEDGKRQTIKKILRNDLIDVFFETLPLALHQPKEGSPKMIPIRLCRLCEKAFLARQWNQLFCSPQHSQNWRAREVYRMSKEG